MLSPPIKGRENNTYWSVQSVQLKKGKKTEENPNLKSVLPNFFEVLYHLQIATGQFPRNAVLLISVIIIIFYFAHDFFFLNWDKKENTKLKTM